MPERFIDTVETDATTVLELDSIARWDVYNRLQELSIPCQCACGQPLRIDVKNPAMALQVWSVVRRLTQPRAKKIAALENCWKKPAYR